jgi:hypothetical protein
VREGDVISESDGIPFRRRPKGGAFVLGTKKRRPTGDGETTVKRCKTMQMMRRVFVRVPAGQN